MPETVINLDISELVEIGNRQLEYLEDMDRALHYNSDLLVINNNISLALLVVLGAVLGAVVFRHLRK